MSSRPCRASSPGLRDESLGYARQRPAFGRPIGQYQAIQFKLADMEVRVHAARLGWPGWHQGLGNLAGPDRDAVSAPHQAGGRPGWPPGCC